MSQLSDFVKKRAINNVITATVVGVRPNNPMLFDVKLPDLKTVTLAAAQPLSLSVGDAVEVIRPQGNNKLEYISGPAAVLLAGDPFNRLVVPGQG